MPRKSAANLDVAPNDNDRPYIPCLHKAKSGNPMPPWPNDAWPWRGMIHPPAKCEDVPGRVRLLQVLISAEMVSLRDRFHENKISIRAYNAHVKQAWAQFSLQFEWMKSMLESDEIYLEMLDWDTDRRLSGALPGGNRQPAKATSKANDAPVPFDPPDNFAGAT